MCSPLRRARAATSALRRYSIDADPLNDHRLTCAPFTCSGSGTSWENSPRDMREEDAHAIAARLGSYERTYSTEVPRFRSVGRQSEEIMPKPAKKV